jgi:hypothetical protein
MTNDDPRIDDLLRAAGAAWRSDEDLSGFRMDPNLLHAARPAISPAKAVKSLATIVLITILGLLVVVSIPLGGGQTGVVTTTTTAPPTSAAVTVLPSPTATATTHPSATPSDAAIAACSAIIDNIPMVKVRSGKVTIAAAYEVTGEQLTRYFITVLNHGEMSNGSDWWNQAANVVDLCIFDGDFDTQTPGPPGHDTTAVRVLVVIDGSGAFSWAFCFSDPCGIAITDPATIPASSTLRPRPPSPRRRPPVLHA